MTAQQEAYINGFVKRANQHGLSDYQAIELLKESGALESPTTLKYNPGAMTASQAGSNPVKPVSPALPDGVPNVTLAELDSRNRKPAAAIKVAPMHKNELGKFTPRR